MKQKMLLAGMLIFVVLCSTHASAQPCRRMAGAANANQPGWNCPSWLNLAPEQQTAINSLRDGFMKETATIQNQIHKKHLEMNILLFEAEPDTNILIKLQKEISGLKASLDEKKLMYQIKARKQLSPDQITQLPPGCTMGMGQQPCASMAGPGPGFGPGMGYGMGCRRYGCWGW
jgi:Spy/CpxP family protein refolding chaperone